TPYNSLIRDTERNFYGTTTSGGDSTCGCGTVFSLHTLSNALGVLHTFTGVDGALPRGLVWGPKRILYGSTSSGGVRDKGTVFKLDRITTELRVQHNFNTSAGGGYPVGGLILDAAGNFYGTALEGGNISCRNGCGTVFQLNQSGMLSVLHTFTGSPDGMDPE